MKSLLKLFICMSFILGAAGCGQKTNEASLKSLMLDRDVKKKVAEKKPEEALNLYYKMLETDPELSEVHLNIGSLFMEAKKVEEASKSLNQALKLADEHKDAKMQFAARYNLGVYYQAQKKVPEALEHYQAALEFVPSSKETKHNIELLIQQNSKDKSKGGDDKKDSDQKDKDGKSDDKKDQSGKDDKDKKDNQDKKDDKDKKDEKDKDKKDDKDGKDDKDKEKKPDQAQNSPKYKPRPFQGDQLSEGDVKKILGELKNQEQKIRANFEKKERKENKNEKDW